MNNNEILVNFLKELTNQLENNQIENNNIIKISQFMMSYNFESSNNNEIDEDFSRGDMVKFLSLGWYIYTQVLNSETVI
tara:strand:- start:740 stop:976 length:237 start_codon:yes stop_codon:yes gene_type:complete